MADAFWTLAGLDHGLRSDGSVLESSDPDQGPADYGRMGVFFEETRGGGKFTPRALLADLDPSTIDEMKHQRLKKFWHPHYQIKGSEDAADNFAIGYYTHGHDIMPAFEDRLRLIVEGCNHLNGIFLTHGIGGGTGGGFASRVLNMLAEEYTRTPTASISVIPSAKMSTSIVEPLNSTLTLARLSEHCDVSLAIDNSSMYKIFHEFLGVKEPTFSDLNSLTAQVTSMMTASMRFKGTLNMDMQDLLTNMVPFPRMHYMTSAYGPLSPKEDANHESFSIKNITQALFTEACQLVDTEEKQVHVASTLLYRGSVSPSELNDVTAELRFKYLKFVDWSPTGFKISMNSRTPVFTPGGHLAASPVQAMLLGNTSAICTPLSRIGHKFDLLYSKRAFVFWYVANGMEEGELAEAREDLESLAQEYRMLEDPGEGGNETGMEPAESAVSF